MYTYTFSKPLIYTLLQDLLSSAMAHMRVNPATLIVLAFLLSSICANGFMFPMKKYACPHPSGKYKGLCWNGPCNHTCKKEGRQFGQCGGGWLMLKCCCRI